MKNSIKSIVILVITLFITGNLIAQDTLSAIQSKPMRMKYTPSEKVKWSMFGLNRIHIQDFGITDQYVDTCNCGESRAFLDKSNVSFGTGFYANISKKIAVSTDLGLSYGTIARKKPLIADKKQLWFSTIRADAYYHFTDGKLQMQPYVFGGIHYSSRSSKSLMSMPVGLGLRYMVLNNNGMITAQAGYAIGVSKSLKNNIIYSWGMYVNLSRKKQQKEPTVIDVHQNICPNPILDSDCDGVVDAFDKCDSIPGPVSNEGCPIIDSDNDGIADNNDKCPSVAGPVCNNGCPIEDRDKDGIEDNVDKCPDVFGVATNYGCPIEDRDNDGIPDNVDRCPDQAGTLKDAGCPEALPQILTDTVQFIIYFDFDKYILTGKSFEVLNELIDLLKRDDRYSVLLAGHTDLEGNVEYNSRLSENRVNTVKKYILSYGIEGSRISTNYFGKQKPVISTFEKKLGWQNRRVEVFLIKK